MHQEEEVKKYSLSRYAVRDFKINLHLQSSHIDLVIKGLVTVDPKYLPIASLKLDKFGL